MIRWALFIADLRLYICTQILKTMRVKFPFLFLLLSWNSMYAQIKIETDEEEPVLENPVVGEEGELYSRGLTDTSDLRQYYLQPLDEITIQGNRLQIPFAEQNRNIRVLDQSLIRTLPVKTVNELLGYVSGIDVRQHGPWGTQADIGMDGGTFDQTLVLINGIKISDPQTGHNMMNIPVALDAIERIEVLRGPAARIYGVNALNGAINIITRTPSQTGATVHVYAGSGFERDSADNTLYGGVGIQASASLAGEHAQHYLSLSRDQSSGYRYNTAFQNSKAFYQANMDINKATALQLTGGFVYNSFGANGFYSAPGDKESKETVQTGLLSAGLQTHVNPYWTIRPRISYRYNHDDYIYVRQKPEVYRNRHETHVIDAELNNTFDTDIGVWGLGLELRNERINSSNLGNWQRTNYGFFGEYSFNKIKHLLVNIGAYANYNSDFGWKILPGIDVGYRFYKGWRVFANAGTGQRLPTYTDWYYKGPQNIGNPTLTPEYSSNVEGGIKYSDRKLNGSISYFYKRTNDFIDWVKDTATDPWQPVNYHKINTHGITLAVDYRWSEAQQKNPDFALITGISYTYLNLNMLSEQGVAEDKMSLYAIENLRHQVCANANFEFLRMFNLTLAARYQQRVNYKDYILLDARISFTRSQFNIYLDVTNIGNTQYAEQGAIPLPGRWVTLGVKWAWWNK